jgi:hypothetical protein
MAYKQVPGTPWVFDDTDPDNNLIGYLNRRGELRLIITALPDAQTPASGVKATLTTDMSNATSDVTLTAVDYGHLGNYISVTYVDPSDVDQALSVVVTGLDIVVNLATNGAGTITSTAALVKAAINGSAAASALVVAEDEGAGTGVVNAVVKANLTGGVTVTEGPVGILCFAADNSKIYKKTDSQTWTEIAAPAV